ncbi:hypothetical protein LSTR_LSTR011770 [Laodelphax striatellus]|uniref:Uncharacterized protein n=1 Tax=Laodelphax striatellus TaxID=195883 RepID=A0A482XNK7_LAOST|nr:hypothetical protein LSTR_LSTR011770 [Laodelphax striatellus]
MMRNLILSAFPRNMRLPDPFTPNLKVDMLSEISLAPRVLSNFSTMIQPATFKKDLDSYLKARAPVTFLSELRSNLQSTKQYDNKEIFQVLEKHGGICDCQSSRDTLVYAASADSRGFDAIVSILAEVVYRPKVTVEEVENVRQTIRFELETLMTRPEQEVILTDMIHAAAYRSNTLGLPKICPADNIGVIDRGTLLTYMRNHHTPARTVIAGVGIDHDALVESVQRHFEENKPIWESDVDLSEMKLSDRLKADNSIAQYTGGLVKEECEIPQYVGPSGLPELAHVVVGMEGVSHQDPDFVPVCVLNMMMGGGGSFSAGGPGKGMYTRLYTNVLNRYHWMFSATAYNHSYADSGVFCVHASAPPPYVRDMLDVLLKEFATMAHSVSDTELRRAKTQLQSMLLMNLEARPVVFEDIARQVLATGHRKHPSVFIQAIESVTAADIERVTQRLLRSQPAVAARGAVQKLPTLQDIQAALLDSGSALGQRRNRLFTPK